jgi:hypothetical protein
MKRLTLAVLIVLVIVALWALRPGEAQAVPSLEPFDPRPTPTETLRLDRPVPVPFNVHATPTPWRNPLPVYP